MAAFEHLNKAILTFRTQGMFAQVGQRYHLHAFYRKSHEVFDIARLYDEVTAEVRDMHDNIQIAQAKHLEKRINQLALFLGVPGLVFSFFGINLSAITVNEGGINWWVAIVSTLVVSLVCGFFGRRLLEKQ